MSREEIGRLLCDVLVEIDEVQERAKFDAAARREKLAELRARAKGMRDYLRGKKGAQAPLPVDTSPTRGGPRDG